MSETRRTRNYTYDVNWALCVSSICCPDTNFIHCVLILDSHLLILQPPSSLMIIISPTLIKNQKKLGFFFQFVYFRRPDIYFLIG
jgi:hypothetical protein